MSLYAKLEKIQKELNAPKNQYNSFGKYHYRSCEDILGAVKPLLDGCALVVTDEMQLIGDRFYLVATARISDGKDSIEAKGYAREELQKKGMDAAQLTGATSSYARKYALNGLFAIDDTKDSDATNDHGRGQQQRQHAQKPQAQQQAQMSDDVLGVAIGFIGSSETVDALKEAFANSWKQTGCANQRAKLKQAYDSRLAQLGSN